MMIHVAKCIRVYYYPANSYYTNSLLNKNRVSACVKFGQVKAKSITTSSHQPEEDQDTMDKNKAQDKNLKPVSTKEDMMARSFGEAYATRCGDDGFGGIYGDNEPLPEEAEKHETNPNPKTVHIHEGYDTKQGSEVKEKEKAHHQTESSGH